MQWQSDDEEKMNELALDNDLLSCTSPALCRQLWPDQPRAGLTQPSYYEQSWLGVGMWGVHQLLYSFSTGWPQAGAQLSPQGGGLNDKLPIGWVDSGWRHLSRSWGMEKSVIVWPNLPLYQCSNFSWAERCLLNRLHVPASLAAR